MINPNAFIDPNWFLSLNKNMSMAQNFDAFINYNSNSTIAQVIESQLRDPDHILSQIEIFSEILEEIISNKIYELLKSMFSKHNISSSLFNSNESNSNLIHIYLSSDIGVTMSYPSKTFMDEDLDLNKQIWYECAVNEYPNVCITSNPLYDVLYLSVGLNPIGLHLIQKAARLNKKPRTKIPLVCTLEISSANALLETLTIAETNITKTYIFNSSLLLTVSSSGIWQNLTTLQEILPNLYKNLLQNSKGSQLTKTNYQYQTQTSLFQFNTQFRNEINRYNSVKFTIQNNECAFGDYFIYNIKNSTSYIVTHHGYNSEKYYSKVLKLISSPLIRCSLSYLAKNKSMLLFCIKY